MVNQY